MGYDINANSSNSSDSSKKFLMNEGAANSFVIHTVLAWPNIWILVSPAGHYSCFQFTLHYRPSFTNTKADTLASMPRSPIHPLMTLYIYYSHHECCKGTLKGECHLKIDRIFCSWPPIFYTDLRGGPPEYCGLTPACLCLCPWSPQLYLS